MDKVIQELQEMAFTLPCDNLSVQCDCCPIYEKFSSKELDVPMLEERSNVFSDMALCVFETESM